MIEREGTYCEIYSSPIYYPSDTPKELQEKLTVLNEAWEYYCE